MAVQPRSLLDLSDVPRPNDFSLNRAAIRLNENVFFALSPDRIGTDRFGANGRWSGMQSISSSIDFTLLIQLVILYFPEVVLTAYNYSISINRKITYNKSRNQCIDCKMADLRERLLY